jgi:hypothetical protein
MFCSYCGRGLPTFEYNVTEFSNQFECCQYCGMNDPFDGRYCRTDLVEDYLLLPENNQWAKREVRWWCLECQYVYLDDLKGDGVGCYRPRYCAECKKVTTYVPAKPGHLLVGDRE